MVVSENCCIFVIEKRTKEMKNIIWWIKNNILWWVIYGIPIIILGLLPKTMKEKLYKKYSSFYQK